VCNKYSLIAFIPQNVEPTLVCLACFLLYSIATNGEGLHFQRKPYSINKTELRNILHNDFADKKLAYTKILKNIITLIEL
jgi:hypothetical protein